MIDIWYGFCCRRCLHVTFNREQATNKRAENMIISISIKSIAVCACLLIFCWIHTAFSSCAADAEIQFTFSDSMLVIDTFSSAKEDNRINVPYIVDQLQWVYLQVANDNICMRTWNMFRKKDAFNQKSVATVKIRSDSFQEACRTSKQEKCTRIPSRWCKSNLSCSCVRQCQQYYTFKWLFVYSECFFRFFVFYYSYFAM